MVIRFFGGSLDQITIVIHQSPLPTKYIHENKRARVIETYVLTDYHGERIYLYAPEKDKPIL